MAAECWMLLPKMNFELPDIRDISDRSLKKWVSLYVSASWITHLALLSFGAKREGCREQLCRFLPFITVVKASKSWKGYHFTVFRPFLDWPDWWCSFFQSKVRPVFMIVIQILGQNSFQMVFVQDDEVICAITPYTAEKTFNEWILPWGPRCCLLLR